MFHLKNFQQWINEQASPQAEWHDGMTNKPPVMIAALAAGLKDIRPWPKGQTWEVKGLGPGQVIPLSNLSFNNERYAVKQSHLIFKKNGQVVSDTSQAVFTVTSVEGKYYTTDAFNPDKKKVWPYISLTCDNRIVRFVFEISAQAIGTASAKVLDPEATVEVAGIYVPQYEKNLKPYKANVWFGLASDPSTSMSDHDSRMRYYGINLAGPTSDNLKILEASSLAEFRQLLPVDAAQNTVAR